MFKIGDFAKLTRVSVKTLHHYDEIGLFRPKHVDEATGYRYYSFEQLPRLNRILVLKDLGFALEHISKLLNEGLSPGELEGMLRLRQAELEQQVADAQARLANVATRLHQIQREGKMPEHEVILKSVEPVGVASARELVTSPERIRERCLALLGDVFVAVKDHHLPATETTLALYYDSAEGIDVEMVVFLEGHITPQQHGRVTVKQLPAERMASVVYKGSFNAFDVVGQIHADIGRWIEATATGSAGPALNSIYNRPKSTARTASWKSSTPLPRRKKAPGHSAGPPIRAAIKEKTARRPPLSASKAELWT